MTLKCKGIANGNKPECESEIGKFTKQFLDENNKTESKEEDIAQRILDNIKD